MPLKLLLDENLRFGAVWHAIAAHNQTGTYQLDVIRVGDDGAPPLGASDEAVMRRSSCLLRFGAWRIMHAWFAVAAGSGRLSGTRITPTAAKRQPD